MKVPLSMENMMLPPVHTGRAYWHAYQTHGEQAAIQVARAMYKAHWTDGKDLGDASEVAHVGATTLGVDYEEMLAGIKSPEAKKLHAQGVKESIEAGVWGSPTFVVDGEIFWGVDRLWMVEEWLKSGDGGWCKGTELPTREQAEAFVEYTSVYGPADLEAKSKL
jgi:2-hydroxychromene-2-carboxylate isomerase